MQNKTPIIGIVVILLALIAVAYYAYTDLKRPLPVPAVASFAECAEAGYPVMESFPRQCRTPDGRTFVEEAVTDDVPEVDDRIRVAEPQPDTAVTSPLDFRGEARGMWYFEASFPVELLDANGKRLAQTIATAEDDWMTEEFVPFSGTISWSETPETPSGILRFHRDNPSGLPEHDASVDVPVVFAGSRGSNAATTGLSVFFANAERAEGNPDCSLVFPALRSVPATSAVARTALEELLGGPTNEERAAGFETLIPSGVRMNTLVVENGVARADFSRELSEGVAGACRVVAIRAQIEATLKQFPIVKSVVISVEGETETVLQP